MSTTYVYVTHPITDTVHLSRSYPGGPASRTICGRSARGFVEGDETQSGTVATCDRCRMILGSD